MPPYALQSNVICDVFVFQKYRKLTERKHGSLYKSAHVYHKMGGSVILLYKTKFSYCYKLTYLCLPLKPCL